MLYHVEVVKNIKTVVKSEIKMLTENTMLTSFIFDYLNNIYEEELDLNSRIKEMIRKTVQ